MATGAIAVERNGRFSDVGEAKSSGIAYTPPELARFVAQQIVGVLAKGTRGRRLRVLDPAVGDGALLMALLAELQEREITDVDVDGYETDRAAMDAAIARLSQSFPTARLQLKNESFLDAVTPTSSLFAPHVPSEYDAVISNPPYVRTQVMGASRAQSLAAAFALSGRVDLYQAFLLGISVSLEKEGVAGVIVSNRFMTTRAGATVRGYLRDHAAVRHVWDLGDTKLFGAAVLPAVLLFERKKSGHSPVTKFSSIYSARSSTGATPTAGPVEALEASGLVQLPDGRAFTVQHGALDAGLSGASVWRLATEEGDAWLAQVTAKTAMTFGALGKIRVGVKTCADSIFIREDWSSVGALPELLRPLTTHHTARRFRALPPRHSILYPHEIVNGKRRPVDLRKYPQSSAYLEKHRSSLEERLYVLEAGREWFEVWVPQDPDRWRRPKLVFRDISERPEFWVDLDGSVVNGDCYWLAAESEGDDELLWLAAAVANSRFIERFYDHRFHNKLYAGRRRFITQYVEAFPMPDPSSAIAKKMKRLARQIYEEAGQGVDTQPLEEKLEPLVWQSFGLGIEEVASSPLKKSEIATVGMMSLPAVPSSAAAAIGPPDRRATGGRSTRAR